jgi:hypothetical protein
VDRIFLQAYVPKLQSVGWVCQFLRWQRGFPIPSSSAFGKIGDGHVQDVHRFAGANDIPVVHFGKGDNKEAIARPLIHWTAADRQYETLRIGMQTLFRHLGLTTAAA